jgi:alanine racemase
MGRPTQALILLEALTNNWKLLTEYASPKAPLIPVLKANAYGHGAVTVALHLQKLGVKLVAVAVLDEARELRKAGFKKQILLLGPFLKKEISEIKTLQVTPVVGSMYSLKLLIEYSAKRFNFGLKTEKNSSIKLEIHLKWDTSMNRLGLREEELPEVDSLLSANRKTIQVKGLCTHLLRGEDLGSAAGFSAIQIQKFKKISDHFKSSNPRILIHVFNSDAFFQSIESRRFDPQFGARIGLALYGYTSVETQLTQKLKPVMRLISKIVQLKFIKKGESVSYNATWMAKRNSVIAVVPMGYADGYRRALSNKGQVLVRDMMVSVVGTVCMDYFMIDVTDVHVHTHLTLGEDVEIWGERVSLKDLSKKIDTIPYELLTTLGSRVKRVAVIHKNK